MTGTDGNNDDSLLLPGPDRRPIAEGQYDPSRHESLTTAIVSLIAEVQDVVPSEVTPPLYQFTDPTTIPELFDWQHGQLDTGEVSGIVAFRYTDYVVTINSAGRIQIFASSD